jgi:nifR3 family TIM-barrel protein
MAYEQKLGREAFSIGDVSVEGQCILAPLSGVTDVAFRRIAMRFGAGLVISEMVASDEFVGGSEEARLRAEGEGVSPHVIQLAGCDPRWMAQASKLAEGSGAQIIDINMGCPAKRVTGGEAGSALMRDLDHAARLIAATVEAVSIPVTVKMRLGWDERRLNAPDLARRAEVLGVRAITVHGRTRQQFYKGSADWTGIARAVDAVAIPVVANGDIRSVQDARRCLSQSRASAVMVGRAAMGRPWLVGQIAAAFADEPVGEPTTAQKTEAVMEHYEGLLSLYGRKVGIRHARKHLAAYADAARSAGCGLSAGERLQLVTADDPATVKDLLRRMYAIPLRNAA